MATQSTEFQFSLAASKETYSLLAVSAMASSASSTFAAVQLVVKHQSDLSLCTAVNSINTTLFSVPVIKTEGKGKSIFSVSCSPAKTTHVAVAGQDQRRKGRRKEETNFNRRKGSPLGLKWSLLFRWSKRRVGRSSVTLGWLARLVCSSRSIRQQPNQSTDYAPRIQPSTY